MKPMQTAVLSIGLACGLSGAALAEAVRDTTITEADVLAAQQAWGDALVRISDAHAKGGQDAARAAAEQALDSAYDYAQGPVLFKPTLTTDPQIFRTDREGALSYFVGGNPDYPQDTGFALKEWADVEVDNAAVMLNGDLATSLGTVQFTDRDGNVTTVDKSWTFRKDDAGVLRIIQHHSSLQFQG